MSLGIDAAIRATPPALAVVLPAHVGDCVFALGPLRAAQRALAEVGGALSFVGVGRGADLVASQFPGARLASVAPRGRPVVLLAPSLRVALQAVRAGAAPRYGVAGDGRTLLLRRAVRRVPERGALPAVAGAALLCREPQPAQYARVIAAALGDQRIPSAEVAEDDGRITLDGATLSEGRRLWEDLGRPTVLLHPAAAGLKTKQGTAAAWSALAARLDLAGHRILWTGGPRDLDRVRSVQGRWNARVGEEALPLLLWAAVARCCDVVIAPDTGTAHVAAAAGAMVRIAFGPTDPRRHPPPAGTRGHTTVHSGSFRGCTACYQPTCRFERTLGTVPCIDDALLRIGAAIGREATTA